MVDEGYVYKPLPEGPLIRLLSIHPSDRLDNPLVCDVHVVSLADEPSYAALSYCWGNPTRNCSLTCNERIVPITHSLYRALKRFRRTESRTLIWADAICINQDDNAERSKQVLLMTQIYRQARTTYVYLGEPEDQPHSPNAVDALEKWILARARAAAETHISISDLISLMHNNRDTTVDTLLRDVLSASTFPDRRQVAAWMAWQLLFTRPWFSRIWVIQEATASPESTIIQIGAFGVSWNSLLAANVASYEYLSESDVNQAFFINPGYRVCGTWLDSIEAVARWKQNRGNLETMDAIGRTLHPRRELEKIKRSMLEHDMKTGYSPLLSHRRWINGVKLSSDSGSASSVHHNSASVSDTSMDTQSEDIQAPEEGGGSDSRQESGSEEDRESDSETTEDSSQRETERGSVSESMDDSLTGTMRRQQDSEGDEQSTSTNDSEKGPISSLADETEWSDRKERTEQERSHHLFQLLIRCCKFSASDPRDVLYALRGLASDEEYTPKPDYTKESHHIFHQYAAYFVSQGYGIELLTMAASCTKPSWVPNFAEIGLNVPGHPAGWARRHFLTFNAGGKMREHVRLNPDTDTLALKGSAVDKVQSLGPPLHSPEYFRDLARSSHKTKTVKSEVLQFSEWNVEWNWMRKFDNHIIEWDKETAAFIESQRQSGAFGDSSAAAIKRIYNTVISADVAAGHEDKNETSIIAEMGKFDFGIVQHFSQPRKEVRDRVIEIVQARRVCVTEKGRLGLVPQGARAGDIIYIFLGAPAPFVGRKDGKVMTLIGDAFVHNLMHGEALKLEASSIENVIIY